MELLLATNVIGLGIIDPLIIITNGGTYTENCALLGLESLADKRDWQSRKLFKQNSLSLPAKRDETSY